MGKFIDLTGKIKDDFEILSFDNTRGKYKYYWNCRCINCGNKKSIASSRLADKNKTIKCEKCNPNFNVSQNIKGYRDNLTGRRFGKLTVLSYSHKEYSHSIWNCKCDCGNIIKKNVSYLHNSKYLMCDECMHSVTKKEKITKEKVKIPFEEIAFQTKNNNYEIFDDYAIINSDIIVDTDDLGRILSFKRYVSKNSSGYAYMNWRGKELFLHRLLMDLPQEYDFNKKIIVDHINGNRLDNRKSNLRICHKGDNPINCKIYKTNTSGCKGVSWNKKLNKWQVSLDYKKVKHYLGVYSDYNEAIKVRKEAEKKYFGEFNRNEEYLNNGQI